MEFSSPSADADAQRCERRLADCGIRPTAQRVRIASLLLSCPQHLSAEQILASLRVAGARVSKATVYNTLNLFVEKKLIREVIVDPDRVFYDPNTAPHYHIYNIETGQLTDIDAQDVRIEGLPKLPPGMVTESMDIIIRVRGGTLN